jgi:hypothetical protein
MDATWTTFMTVAEHSQKQATAQRGKIRVFHQEIPTNPLAGVYRNQSGPRRVKIGVEDKSSRMDEKILPLPEKCR